MPQKFLRQDEAAKKIIKNLSGKMEFNDSTRLSLERNYDSIVGMQKDCDARLRSQREHNHSIYTRKERIKIETKKGYSRRVGPSQGEGPDLGLSAPASSP
jgi:hypothetical protein